MDLPQEYWLPQTLMEIANGVGTPLLIDEATKKHAFGQYAHILVDMCLSKLVDVVYARLLEFCSNCFTIGHSVALCNKLHLKPKEHLISARK